MYSTMELNTAATNTFVTACSSPALNIHEFKRIICETLLPSSCYRVDNAVEGDWHSAFLHNSVAITYGTLEAYPIAYSSVSPTFSLAASKNTQ